MAKAVDRTRHPRAHLRRWVLCISTLLLAQANVIDRAMAAQPGDEDRVEQHVIFMIDLSGSMPAERKGMTFEQQIQARRADADRILGILERQGGVKVSFWGFGDRGEYRPRAKDTTYLDPADARNRLDDVFVSAEPGQKGPYTHGYTYIAHSIYGLTVDQLELGDDFTLDDDIPQGAELLYIFVLTDASEDHGDDPDFDNRPYTAWLDRQRRSSRVQIYDWNILESIGFDSDHLTYKVFFGKPALAYVLNPASPPPQNRAELLVPRQIKLVPDLGSGSVTDEEAAAWGWYSCEGELSDDQRRAGPRLVSPAVLDVPLEIEWPLAVDASRSTPWRVAAPARDIVGLSESGSMTGVMDRGILRLQIEDTAVYFPETDLPDGEYPIFIDHEQLCDELASMYPFSEFVFVPQPEHVAHLGVFRVDRRAVYKFELYEMDGAAPDGEMLVTSDGWTHWHRFLSVERSLRVTPPAGVEADVDYSLSVWKERGGTHERFEAPGFAALVTPDGESGASVTHAAGEPVELRIPAERDIWLDGFLGTGFRGNRGDYELEMCVEPKLDAEVVGTRDHSIAVTCSTCGREAQTTADKLCVRIPVEVTRCPPAWGAIALVVLVVFAVAFVIIRWVTRVNFRENVIIGEPDNNEDLHDSYKAGCSGILNLYLRDPCYWQLGAGGETHYYADYVGVQKKARARQAGGTDTSAQAGDSPATEPTAAVGNRTAGDDEGKTKVPAMTLVGLRPRRRDIFLWCAQVEETADGSHWEVRLSTANHPFRPVGEGPPDPTFEDLGDAVVEIEKEWVSYDEIDAGVVTLYKRLIGADGEMTREEIYRIVRVD